MTSSDDIPIAHTPTGGWRGEMPPPVLAGCDEPIVVGAPDLRGLWVVDEVVVDGGVVSDHPVVGKQQRIEQTYPAGHGSTAGLRCGDRLVVTASGVVHDMRCDGTEGGGVHDVAQVDFKTPIVVVASYENSVHVLRPKGMPFEVRRWRDGASMMWDYGGAFVARLSAIEHSTSTAPVGEGISRPPLRYDGDMRPVRPTPSPQ